MAVAKSTKKTITIIHKASGKIAGVKAKKAGSKPVKARATVTH